jgi:hypothetical protein
MTSFSDFIFAPDSLVSFSPSCLTLSFRIGHCSGSAMPLSSGISGSIGSLSPATPFSARLWTTQFMPLSGLNTLATSQETSSLVDSLKASMTVTLREYWVPRRVLGPLAAVRYHGHRLAPYSFDHTDSAPFRASVLLKYADWLTEPEQKNGTWAADVLWPAINLDLQWVCLHWNESSYVGLWPVSVSKLISPYSYDIWLPPVWAGNYWTSYMQYRALKHGAYVGRKIGRGEDSSDFESRASLILDYLQARSHFSPVGYLN